MTEREFDAVSRLTAWIKEFGYRHTDVFNEDIRIVLEMARHSEPSQVGCTCHERDSSFTCEYCKTQGRYGHMERNPSEVTR